MYPILFQLGKFTIYTYGFFVALGFIVGILYARQEAIKVGEDPERVLDLIFYIIISGIVGARLFYVATNLSSYISDPLGIFKIWEGGLVFYGGFITALITAFIYVKMKGMSVGKIADIAGPTLALGHAVSRIGCFFAGCCFGKECDLPWAVTFNHTGSLAKQGVPLHPTQLYSTINLLIIFGILLLLKSRMKIKGQLFWVYIFLYGMTRSIIEIFRGDPRGAFLFGFFSVSQTIGLTMSAIAIFMLIYLGKQVTIAQKNA